MVLIRDVSEKNGELHEKARNLKGHNRHIGNKTILKGSKAKRQGKNENCVQVKDTEIDWFDYLHKLDVGLSKELSFCAKRDAGHWRSVLILLEITGHGIPWIAGSIIGTLLFSELRQEFACNLFLALMLDLSVVGSTKVAVQRKRPLYNEQDMFGTVSVDNYSFPSGHSTRAAMVAAMFAVFLSSISCRILIGCWAVCVSVSRVILGRHHVSDVVCGIVIGLLQFWVVYRVVWIHHGTCQELLQLVPFYTKVRNWLLLV